MVFFLCEKKAYIFDIQRPYLFCTLSAPSRGKIWNFFPHHLSLRYMNEFLVYMALPEQCAVCSFACQHPTWTIFTWMIFNFHWSHGIESFLWVIQCCSMGVVEFAPLCNDQQTRLAVIMPWPNFPMSLYVPCQGRQGWQHPQGLGLHCEENCFKIVAVSRF